MDEAGSIVGAGYDRAAEHYSRLEQTDAPWPRLRWLRAVLSQLPDGARVLDLGCGSGAPVAREIADRHRVVGVDVSPRQIELAEENVPGGEFVCADALDVDFPPESFDAVVSLYTIDHVPRDEHSPLLERMGRWLKPGGLLLVSVEDADRPEVRREWLGVEMYFSHFDAETTCRIARDAGFRIEVAAVEGQLEGDVEVSYLWLLARRPHDRTPGLTG